MERLNILDRIRAFAISSSETFTAVAMVTSRELQKNIHIRLLVSFCHIWLHFATKTLPLIYYNENRGQANNA
jgi:hypothetical protein